jgi:CDP-diacylglycerol--glycerol-3-phosphate 3-phosphatidyltransferase
VLKAKLGEQLETWVPRILPFVFSRRLSPAALTITGTLICLTSAVAFALGEFGWGGGLLLAGGAFDILDGMVARRHGIESKVGAFLDSTLDRLVDMALLVGLMIHYAVAGEPLWVALAGFVLITSVMTSYAKARAETLGPIIGKGIFERGERILLLILAGLTGWMVPILGILAVGGLITVVQRFFLAYRALARTDAESERVGELPR